MPQDSDSYPEAWDPTSGTQGRQASCLGVTAAFLPTKQETTWMGHSEQGLRDRRAMVSIQRQPKMR